MSDNTTRTQCIHCFNFMLVSSNSTLRGHFTHPHCETLKSVSEPRQQSMGRDVSVFLYNPYYLCEQFAGLVIQRGLPFNYFDHEQPTRVFENTMQPKYNHILIELISTDLEFLDDVHATRTKQWFNESLAGFDVLGIWKSKELMFPVLSRMAIDVLSVQVISVASESAFSTSERVLSIRRTKLTPSSLEMCMCLQYHLDAQERKQDKSTIENAFGFEDEVLDAEVQENEATSLSDEEIALDTASQGTVASGSGGKEPQFDYDLTNYDD
nr:zinc finger BED domain-containing protein DAYSLEEPER-like [Tanacetum cinerariifolium]